MFGKPLEVASPQRVDKRELGVNQTLNLVQGLNEVLEDICSITEAPSYHYPHPSVQTGRFSVGQDIEACPSPASMEGAIYWNNMFTTCSERGRG